MLTSLRDYSLTTLQELERRGYVISYGSLRRYSGLLPTRNGRRRYAYARTPFTEEEVNWLEWIICLKSLGMTNAEITTWLANPDPYAVRQRIERTKKIIGRTEALFDRATQARTTTPPSAQGAGHVLTS